jgi:signal transduction histidine kinase
MLLCYALRLVLMLLSPLPAYAPEPIVETITNAVAAAPHAYDNIGKRVIILEDKHNSLTLEQVIRLGNSGKFMPSKEAILNLGNSESAFWIKISYQNSSKQTAYLMVDVPNIDYIDFYTTDDRGSVIQRHTGSLSLANQDVLATNQNVLANNRYLFDLPTVVNASKGKDVYLKVRSGNLMLVALKIVDAKTLVSHSNYKIGFECIYSGILIMLFVLNIFLFVSVTDRIYLYYSVYIAALFVYVILYLRGYSYILGPDVRRFVNLYPHIFASLATIAAFFFSWEFLGIKERVPKMVPVYKLMISLWIIMLIVAMFSGKSDLAVLVNYLMLISCGVAWYTGLCAYRKGLKPALYYLIAWFAVGLSFVIALLGLTGVIPYYDLSYEVGPIGTTIEMLFLSFALGDRFNHIRQEKNLIKKENLMLVLSKNERLESLVAERTLKLSKANAEKDKLFSIIAHDLRSPFNSLVSILELNDNDMLDFEELKMLLRETRKNVDHIHLTLNNLLYWAKGQMEMPGSNPESFDLAGMVERLVLVYQPLSTSKKVRLETSFSGLCSVFADLNEINLVLRNLIDNAIKFSPQNSVIGIFIKQQAKQVHISVCNAVAENNSEVKLLQDTEEFLSTPGTANEQGIGLGLHLCREYIRLNGGNMQVVVKDNQVTVSFSLPGCNEGSHV